MEYLLVFLELTGIFSITFFGKPKINTILAVFSLFITILSFAFGIIDKENNFLIIKILKRDYVPFIYFLTALVNFLAAGIKEKNEEENRKENIKEKNMIDNGIKIGLSKYNPIIVTFSNGRKKLSLAAPYPETNLAIMDCLSRYVGADRIDSIGENLDVNFTVTREKHEISGQCEQFVMIINNQLLQKLLNENGVSSFS